MLVCLSVRVIDYRFKCLKIMFLTISTHLTLILSSSGTRIIDIAYIVQSTGKARYGVKCRLLDAAFNDSVSKLHRLD